MYITARTSYAVRAMLAMAAIEPQTISTPALAEAEELPFNFLQTILGELRRARLVRSRRGHDGGYRLARPSAEITVGEVVRAMDTSLARLDGDGDAAERLASPRTVRLETLWRAADTALHRVLDETTLADLTVGELPGHVRDLASAPPSGSTADYSD
ncbi:hypothetical protein BJF79_33165 [Actinomadura sp. CNU-125]|uniref:RrF2 family transcriptional regulator n=1 Tax=Actinomadura sp. CNU-125 TaxID=1904961 RepID=UPI0009665CE6|nr:Rrf2 family transcriptional regulator [Actinomadura sp. CNU-125]OLT34668.1 hypothetical protein BJF79_33165 [Actinomadura sp. CNU-125]